jgi:hypothetical protein
MIGDAASLAVASPAAARWRSRTAYLGGGRLLVGLEEPDLMLVVDGADLRNVAPTLRDGRVLPAVTAFLTRTVGDDWRCLDVSSLWGYVGCLLGRLAWRGTVHGLDDTAEASQLRAAGVDANGLTWQVTPVLARTGPKPAMLAGGVPQITLDGAFAGAGDARVDLLYVDARAHIAGTFAGAAALLRTGPRAIVIGWEPNVARRLGREPADDARALAGLGLTPARLLTDGSTECCAWGDVIPAATPTMRCSRTDRHVMMRWFDGSPGQD